MQIKELKEAMHYANVLEDIDSILAYIHSGRAGGNVFLMFDSNKGLSFEEGYIKCFLENARERTVAKLRKLGIENMEGSAK
jgi:hypothetical protein